jgi:hypothetical protein
MTSRRMRSIEIDLVNLFSMNYVFFFDESSKCTSTCSRESRPLHECDSDGDHIRGTCILSVLSANEEAFFHWLNHDNDRTLSLS